MHVTIVQKFMSNKNRTEYSPNRKKNSIKEKEKKNEVEFCVVEFVNSAKYRSSAL
jgi:hypothetical protein